MFALGTCETVDVDRGGILYWLCTGCSGLRVSYVTSSKSSKVVVSLLLRLERVIRGCFQAGKTRCLQIFFRDIDVF